MEIRVLDCILRGEEEGGGRKAYLSLFFFSILPARGGMEIDEAGSIEVTVKSVRWAFCRRVRSRSGRGVRSAKRCEGEYYSIGSNSIRVGSARVPISRYHRGHDRADLVSILHPTLPQTSASTALKRWKSESAIFRSIFLFFLFLFAKGCEFGNGNLREEKEGRGKRIWEWKSTLFVFFLE